MFVLGLGTVIPILIIYASLRYGMHAMSACKACILCTRSICLNGCTYTLSIGVFRSSIFYLLHASAQL